MPVIDHPHWTRAMVFPSEQVPVRVLHWTHEQVCERHDHEFMEIAVIAAGTGIHVTANGEQPLRAGDVILLRPAAWHGYRQCRAMETWNCVLGPELLRRELAWTIEEPPLAYLLWRGPLAPKSNGIVTLRLGAAALLRAVHVLTKFHRLCQADARGHRAAQVGLVLLLLAELAAGVAPELLTGPSAKPVSPVVMKAIRLLEEKPAEEWTLSQLAGAVGVDRSYLVRLFNSATGLPPMMHLARYRAERAASLLLRTDLPVSEIGIRVGWPVPCHFARRFRAHFGLSATAYRQRAAASRPAAGEAGAPPRVR